MLHVIDRSHPRWQEQKDVAEEVMKELGIDPANILEVHNKIDRLPAEERISRARAGLVSVSAETGEGIPALQAKIARALGREGALPPGGPQQRRVLGEARRPAVDRSRGGERGSERSRRRDWRRARRGSRTRRRRQARRARRPAGCGTAAAAEGKAKAPVRTGPSRIGEAGPHTPRSRKRPR